MSVPRTDANRYIQLKQLASGENAEITGVKNQLKADNNTPFQFAYDNTTQKYGYKIKVEGVDTFIPFSSGAGEIYLTNGQISDSTEYMTANLSKNLETNGWYIARITDGTTITNVLFQYTEAKNYSFGSYDVTLTASTATGYYYRGDFRDIYLDIASIVYPFTTTTNTKGRKKKNG